MKDLELKKKLLLITYACVLLFVVLKFDFIRGIVVMVFDTLSPFLMGIVIAFILSKPSNFFEELYQKKIKKQGLAKGLAILTSYILFFVIIIAIFCFIVPQLITNLNLFLSRTTLYLRQMEDWANEIMVKYNIQNMDIQQVMTQLNDIIQNISKVVLNYVGDIVPRLISVTTNIVSTIFNLVITLVFSINLIAGKENILRQLKKMNRAYLPEKAADWMTMVGCLVNDIFSRYLIGQVTEACILGGLCFVGMKIFRFDYAILISTLIAVTALIPVVGAWIGGGVSFLLLGLVSPINAVMFLIYLTILQQLENNLIYPRVVGSSIGLPGIWVIFAVTVGGGLFGFVGIMLSVPTMSVIYTLIRENVHFRLSRKEKRKEKERYRASKN